MGKVSVGKCLIVCMTLTRRSWKGRTSLMMGKRACSPLDLSQGTSLSSLLCLRTCPLISKILLILILQLFTVVLENISSNVPCPYSMMMMIVVIFRVKGNSSPAADGSPHESDRKRMRRPYQSKTYKVEISYAAKIPMQAIAQALRGQESENSQEALRVLGIILRQHAAKQYVIVPDHV